MRYSLIQAIAAAGLLLLGTTATAQYRPHVQYTYQDNRENRTFDRVRDDLDRAHASTLPSTPDRNRVLFAQSQLNLAQQAWAEGDYNSSREVDEAIVAIQRVADLNQLSERMRNNLLEDAHDLRSLQEPPERQVR
jgi:hypothetical protein